jgi:hypothetical protein
LLNLHDRFPVFFFVSSHNFVPVRRRALQKAETNIQATDQAVHDIKDQAIPSARFPGRQPNPT